MPRSDREIQDLNSDFHDDETWHQIPANVLVGRGEDRSQCCRVKKCPECSSRKIFYDDHRDEYSCKVCGLVI